MIWRNCPLRALDLFYHFLSVGLWSPSWHIWVWLLLTFGFDFYSLFPPSHGSCQPVTEGDSPSSLFLKSSRYAGSPVINMKYFWEARYGMSSCGWEAGGLPQVWGQARTAENWVLLIWRRVSRLGPLLRGANKEMEVIMEEKADVSVSSWACGIHTRRETALERLHFCWCRIRPDRTGHWPLRALILEVATWRLQRGLGNEGHPMMYYP